MAHTSPRDLIQHLADAYAYCIDKYMSAPSDEDALIQKARAYLAQQPSLKEQALALIDECTDPEGDYLDDNALATIRRAIEQLPDSIVVFPSQC